ncbi:unnamed protein product [Rhodiola kirilowii]
MDSSDDGMRQRGCFCSKNDFFPEESFQSFGNYVQALKETPTRLVDRIFTRSLDSDEHEMKARSQHEMKKTLNWWDLMWFGIGDVIGAGIFVLTGLEARDHAGPAVVLSFVVSGISAMLSVFCYIEFAVEIPVAGGSFAYLRVELGDFMAFLTAGNILLEYVIGVQLLHAHGHPTSPHFAINESYLYDSSNQLIPFISTLLYANIYFLVWFCISGVSEALGGNAHKRWLFMSKTSQFQIRPLDLRQSAGNEPLIRKIRVIRRCEANSISYNSLVHTKSIRGRLDGQIKSRSRDTVRIVF